MFSPLRPARCGASWLQLPFSFLFGCRSSLRAGALSRQRRWGPESRPSKLSDRLIAHALAARARRRGDRDRVAFADPILFLSDDLLGGLLTRFGARTEV